MMMKTMVVSVSDEDNDDDNLLMTDLGSGQFWFDSVSVWVTRFVLGSVFAARFDSWEWWC
ncbi:hypothetical protein HanPI659440_Chr13g0504571 [Helianthus annuus]|nr:hypothetical protein HanPI659440_Chr13g0504571 [Helianthus annuus]